VVDGGTDHLRSLESVGIFFAARPEPRHQFPDRSNAGRRLNDFFGLADTLAHPGKITQPYAHSSTMYCKPARMPISQALAVLVDDGAALEDQIVAIRHAGAVSKQACDGYHSAYVPP
jgi:hypothetical protein